MIVIQLPVEKAYVASEDALKLLDEQLDAAESIKAVGMEQKDCQIENIAKAMESPLTEHSMIWTTKLW